MKKKSKRQILGLPTMLTAIGDLLGPLSSEEFTRLIDEGDPDMLVQINIGELACTTALRHFQMLDRVHKFEAEIHTRATAAWLDNAKKRRLYEERKSRPPPAHTFTSHGRRFNIQADSYYGYRFSMKSAVAAAAAELDAMSAAAVSRIHKAALAWQNSGGARPEGLDRIEGVAHTAGTNGVEPALQDTVNFSISAAS